MWLKTLILFAVVFTVNGFGIRSLEDISVSSLGDEIELWATQDYETESFKEMINFLRIPTELQNSDWRTYAQGPNVAICKICQATANTFLKFRRRGMMDETIKNKIIKLCVLMNIQTENVCRGMVEINMPTVMYIIDSKPNLRGETICGVVFETKSCPLTDTAYEWSIALANNATKEIAAIQKPAKQLNVLQISDLHYDPLYVTNGYSNCREPVCCRKGQNATNGIQAGFWGDYACDTPWHAILNAFDHIKKTHQGISYVYFTGDVIDHGVWETSKKGNTESLKKMYNKIHETFGNVPVYPIFGNHESHPMNQFGPANVTSSNVSTNWVYELAADLWIGYGWLPESTRSTILKGGYYTVSPSKRFRIIALNSNVCYAYNWWLLYTPRDPDDQLQWLHNTLLDAEKNNEFVHILSHIPANSKSCLNTWKREYTKIINRFSHLIKAEFNGHTHNDEFVMFYDANQLPKNVAWNGGSITTYTKLNPNYKVYTMNGSNYEVIDYQNWIYDVDSANKNASKGPKWYKSYSFKSEYGLRDLSLKSIDNWIKAAVNDKTLVDKYYKNFFKRARPSLQTNCDLNCKKNYLSRAIAS